MPRLRGASRKLCGPIKCLVCPLSPADLRPCGPTRCCAPVSYQHTCNRVSGTDSPRQGLSFPPELAWSTAKGSGILSNTNNQGTHHVLSNGIAFLYEPTADAESQASKERKHMARVAPCPFSLPAPAHCLMKIRVLACISPSGG